VVFCRFQFWSFEPDDDDDEACFFTNWAKKITANFSIMDLYPAFPKEGMLTILRRRRRRRLGY